jgi:iron complex outermembrane receptor protein
LATNTQVAYDGFITAIRNSPIFAGSAAPAFPVAFLLDARPANNGTLETQGIDFQGFYDWDMDPITAHLGLSGTYVFKLDESQIAGTAPVDHLNQFAFNTQFRFRAEAGVTYNGLSGTVYVNYVNSYDIDPALTHPAAPAGQFTDIDSYTTVDMSLGYDTGDEISVPVLRNILLTVNVSNLFDTDPPFVLNAAASNPVLFDPMNASPIGRVVTIKVAKQW